MTINSVSTLAQITGSQMSQSSSGGASQEVNPQDVAEFNREIKQLDKTSMQTNRMLTTTLAAQQTGPVLSATTLAHAAYSKTVKRKGQSPEVDDLSDGGMATNIETVTQAESSTDIDSIAADSEQTLIEEITAADNSNQTTKSGQIAISQDEQMSFESIVNADEMQSKANMVPVQEVLGLPMEKRNPTLGDAILQSFYGLKDRVDQNFNRVAATQQEFSGLPEIQVKDLWRLQVEVATFSFELQVCSDITTKTTQHVDTFLRAQ